MEKLLQDKRKLAAVIAGVVVVISLIILAVSSTSGKDSNNGNNDIKTETPVMMCFISSQDEKAQETATILDELVQEYDNKVKFTIINIDDDPDAVERFSLNALNPTGNPTPTYILLDTTGDFKDLKAGFNDKAALEESIKKVLE